MGDIHNRYNMTVNKTQLINQTLHIQALKFTSQNYGSLQIMIYTQ